MKHSKWIDEYWINGSMTMMMQSLVVLTVQFSQTTISCVSWGVKENRQRYSGIAEYPIDLYSGIAEYPIDLLWNGIRIGLELNSSSSIS